MGVRHRPCAGHPHHHVAGGYVAWTTIWGDRWYRRRGRASLKVGDSTVYKGKCGNGPSSSPGARLRVFFFLSAHHRRLAHQLPRWRPLQRGARAVREHPAPPLRLGLLFALVFHALNGLRVVVVDFFPGAVRPERLLTVWVAGSRWPSASGLGRHPSGPGSMDALMAILMSSSRHGRPPAHPQELRDLAVVLHADLGTHPRGARLRPPDDDPHAQRRHRHRSELRPARWSNPLWRTYDWALLTLALFTGSTACGSSSRTTCAQPASRLGSSQSCTSAPALFAYGTLTIVPSDGLHPRHISALAPEDRWWRRWLQGPSLR